MLRRLREYSDIALADLPHLNLEDMWNTAEQVLKIWTPRFCGHCGRFFCIFLHVRLCKGLCVLGFWLPSCHMLWNSSKLCRLRLHHKTHTEACRSFKRKSAYLSLSLCLALLMYMTVIASVHTSNFHEYFCHYNSL